MMMSNIQTYDDFFKLAFGQPPFAYQSRTAVDARLPELLNAPTGAGKTAAIIGAWLWHRLKTPESVGRRLVYCLPMRTLVEQTWRVAQEAIRSLVAADESLKDRFTVHALLGGDMSDVWDARPEQECIIVGTQDMLLSRALNRGYAMSRYRWAFQFGLLNNDSLWVFDEVQLMGEGLAASTQLQAMREKMETFGACRSLWMSATLDRRWLKTIDFAPQVETLNQIELTEDDRSMPVMAKRLHAPKTLEAAPPHCRLPEGLATFALENHTAGTQTLVVVNRVARARETFAALEKGAANVSPAPELRLIHSRFRPHDRNAWSEMLNKKPDATGAGRIIVATQVIEAGLDISSRLLITDLAPYASLVQRLGRCNRTGENEAAQVFWVDRPLVAKDFKLADKETLDDKELERIARPYEAGKLETARKLLLDLTSVAPTDLEHIAQPDSYTPAHYPRQRDIVDLFDTTPDLSGNDIDISRWIRGGDERDCFVAWREGVGDGKTLNKDTPRLFRDELCPVPVYSNNGMREFLKTRKAFTWDTLGGNRGEGEWHEVRADDVRVGMTLLMDVDAKGYDATYGWRGNDAPKKQPDVEPVQNEKPQRLNGYGSDPRSFLTYVQTLKAHSREVRSAAESLLDALADLQLPASVRDDIVKAAHHHDWGKAHPVFQATMQKGLPDEMRPVTELLAKTKGNHRHTRRYFRHELASALALMQTGASDLCAYLAATHHGKVRLSIRAIPGEKKPDRTDAKYA
jgi:CRISPR-associated endonuclease/helicase Cas3